MKMRESGGGFVPWKECVSKQKKNAEKAAENKSDKVIMVCPRNEVVGKKMLKNTEITT